MVAARNAGVNGGRRLRTRISARPVRSVLRQQRQPRRLVAHHEHHSVLAEHPRQSQNRAWIARYQQVRLMPPAQRSVGGEADVAP